MIRLYKKGLLDIFSLDDFDDYLMETYMRISEKELFDDLCRRKLDHECEFCENVRDKCLVFVEQGPFDLTNLFEYGV